MVPPPPLRLTRQWGLSKNLHNWLERTSTDQSLLILCICLCSAVVSDRMGYTYVLGAFLAGN